MQARVYEAESRLDTVRLGNAAGQQGFYAISMRVSERNRLKTRINTA
jgi:hypothetical protein